MRAVGRAHRATTEQMLTVQIEFFTARTKNNQGTIIICQKKSFTVFFLLFIFY